MIDTAAEGNKQAGENNAILRQLVKGQEEQTAAIRSVAEQAQANKEENIRQSGRLDALERRATPVFPNKFNGSTVQ